MINSSSPYFFYLLKGGENMSKDSYDNIEELYADLLNDIKNSVGEEVAKEMKKIEQEVIDRNVYSAFSPKVYERRKDGGGLRSEDNMVTDISPNGDGVIIEIENMATGNERYNDYWTGEIHPLIESGSYMWNGTMPPPRPFIDETQKEVDNKIDKIVEDALNKLGW